MEKFKKFYNKYYKLFIILPLLIFFFSLFYLFYFYSQTGDLFYKDVSLTGGTTISLFFNISEKELSNFLSEKTKDFEIKSLTDSTGKKTSIILTIPEKNTQEVISYLESFLGEKLTQENSSIETTSSSLSKDFHLQLISSVIISFFLMSMVVFFVFAKGKKIKLFVFLLTFISIFLIRISFFNEFFLIRFVSLLFVSILIFLYYKYSIPSFAVMFAAASDIILTLTLTNIFGIKLSTAGIVAFLMLLGYSVDTDILLTMRVLKRKNTSINEELLKAFKTGITMTLTSLFAIGFALFFIYRFQTVLNQIFTILLIGLSFDIFNTWLFNASLIKWFAEKNETHI